TTGSAAPRRTRARSSRPTRSRVDARGRFGRADDGMNGEVDEVAPARDPGVEERAVVGLHELEAARERRVDTARHVGEPVGGEAALGAEAAIDGRGVAVLEVLDDHVEHAATIARQRAGWRASDSRARSQK